MIKVAVIVCSLCAAAGGTALWVETHDPNRPAHARTAMSTSFWELYNNAHLEGMPILTEEERPPANSPAATASR
jgi:hypothetical protein